MISTNSCSWVLEGLKLQTDEGRNLEAMDSAWYKGSFAKAYLTLNGGGAGAGKCQLTVMNKLWIVWTFQSAAEDAFLLLCYLSNDV